MNILAIGAHPDDIEIGCGGTLLKAGRSGHNLFLLTLTKGGASGNTLQRAHEMIQSARYLRAKRLWIDNFKDTKLSNSGRLISHIEYFIHVSNPNIIFTHTTSDYHHDHRAVAESTIEAARAQHNVLSYEVPLTKQFEPKLYCEVTDVIDEKLELISNFTSQKNKTFMTPSAIKSLGRLRACQNRFESEYVEAFEIVKLGLDGNFQLTNTPKVALPNTVIEAVKSDIGKIIEYNPGEGYLRPLSAIRIHGDINSDENNGHPSLPPITEVAKLEKIIENKFVSELALRLHAQPLQRHTGSDAGTSSSSMR